MMTKRRHIITAFTAALLLGATAMPASAKPGKWKAHPNQNRAHPVHKNYVLPAQPINTRAYTVRQGYPLIAQNSISAAEAKSIARRRVKGGEVVDIARNGDTYRVRVIARDGRVVDVFIDANTGRVKR